MEKFNEGDIVCINLQELFDSNEPLLYGHIEHSTQQHQGEGDTNYYDLINEDGEFACCDGEMCRIEQAGQYLYTLRSEGDSEGVFFTLTQDEMDIACF